MTDLDQKVRELRALAEKATPGEWVEGEQPVHYPGMVRPVVNIYADRLVGSAEHWVDEDGHENAAYIAAACPATLTAILDEFDRRGAALVEAERLRSEVAGIRWHSADRDNIEFTARINYFQMDKIRAALTTKGKVDD